MKPNKRNRKQRDLTAYNPDRLHEILQIPQILQILPIPYRRIVVGPAIRIDDRPHYE